MAQDFQRGRHTFHHTCLHVHQHHVIPIPLHRPRAMQQQACAESLESENTSRLVESQAATPVPRAILGRSSEIPPSG